MTRRPRLGQFCVAVVAVLVVTTSGTAGQQPDPNLDPVLVGAGDIVPDCLSGASVTHAKATAALLDGIEGTVFTLGDNAYVDGTFANFTNCYDPTWGRHRLRTFPVPGNHDYHTPGAEGFFDYFNGNNQTGPAGDRGQGYYSYELGSWHVVVLNSECGSSGRWDVDGCLVGSPQELWLRADLARSPTNNIIAMFHKPRFSTGWSESAVQPLWKALYDYGADVVLNGHVHSYERLAPAGPTGSRDDEYGIKQFIVGTGGITLRPTASPRLAISEIADDTAHGVLKLTLHASSYDWQFIPTVAGGFSDAGTAAVHGPPMERLVGNWQMEENGGQTLLDSSGLKNDATVIGAPGWVPGPSGLALSLNGTTDYAVVADNPTLDPSRLTLALWIKATPVAATQYVLFKKGAYALLLSSSGQPYFRLNGSSTYRIFAATTQTNGEWVHLAGTYDGASMHFYVNGVEQGVGIPGPSGIAASALPLGIGARSDGTGKYQGSVDDIRVYNRALSAAEIQELMTAGPSAPVAAGILPER